MSAGPVGLIWAQAANGVIGRDGTLPWRLPEDGAHFRSVTAGSTVVMGRRTWESLPARFRPLPGRRNLVLTRDASWTAAGAESFGGLRASLGAVDGPVWVIGGAAVYAEALPLADVAEITELADSFDGNVHAPAIGPGFTARSVDPPEGWHTSATGIRYRFRSWVRAA